MRLDDLVPTRATCEKMNAAGFDQDTLYSWHEETDDHGNVREIVANAYMALRWPGSVEICAAPTFAEIAERLPEGIHVRKLRECWCIHESDDPMPDTPSATDPANAAEAAALLWLSLNAKEPSDGK